jgi:hypothetical protein
MSENKFIPIQQSIYSVKEMQERSYSFLEKSGTHRTAIPICYRTAIPEGFRTPIPILYRTLQPL